MDTRKRRKEGRCSHSLMFESLQSLPKRAKVHAQRKFAQGSQPSGPALTPMKELRELRERTVQTECRTRLGCSVQGASNAVHPTPPAAPTLMNPPIRPKTEDFLTFLCFRRTSLLPPELEFFETPQLMESGGGSDSQGITNPQDEKSSKSSLQKKKEDMPFPCGKKGVPLSKESIKRNLQDIESEATTGFIRSARVTRSSASLTPTPSFLSSPPSNHVAQEGVPERRLSRKQILLKKAMLFKTKSLKAHRRRVQAHLRSKVENRRGVLPRSDSVKAFSPALNISTRNRTQKSAKLFSLRKKEQISRVLKRLGASVILSSIEKGRVTRSQIEANDDPVVDPPVDKPPITPVPMSSSKREATEEACVKDGRRRKSINEESDTSSASPSIDLRLIKEKAIMEEGQCSTPKDPLTRRSEMEERSRRKVPSLRHDPTLLTNLSHTQVLRKRKITPRKMRVTRQLLSMREENNENELIPPQETIARPRCTRSASDPISSMTRSQTLPKVARITSERSKSCEEELSLGELVVKMKNKVTESHLPEKMETIAENDLCFSLRNRPSRKTKQVAEVYLELMSQRLAKESQKGKDLSDDDIEEDNISISSIKELKALTKSCKNKVDLERCIHEIAERHEKECKDGPALAKESKLQAKSTLGKRSASRAKVSISLPDPVSPKKKMDSSSPEITKRQLRFSNVALAEGSSSTSEGEKDKVSPPPSLPLRWNRSHSPKASECDASSIELPDSLSPRAIRVLHRHTSPYQPKLTQQPVPKDLTNVQHSTVNELSPSSIKTGKQSSPKPFTEETTVVTNNQKILRKRPSSETVKVAKKEVQQTLEEDSSATKEKETEKLTSEVPLTITIKTESSDSQVVSDENENKEIELKDMTNACFTPILRKKSSDNAVSSKGEPRATTLTHYLPDSKDELSESVEPKNLEKNGNHKEEETPAPQLEISECFTPPKPNSPVEEAPNVANNVESFKVNETDNSTLKSKKISKPKCLSFSSRCKRTLSLDSDQKTSPKSIRLKRKFGSMECVISSNMKVDSTEQNHSSTSGISLSQSKPSNMKEVKQKPVEGSLGAVSQWKKSIFSRRRNSIHDEAKLNAVLESVAKDFEKDMDDQLYDKIEKDLNSGNKSPDKTNRTLLDSLEVVKDEKISSPEVQEEVEYNPFQEIDLKREGKQLEEPQLQPDILTKLPEVKGEEAKQRTPLSEMPLPEKEVDTETAVSDDLSITCSPLMQSSPSSSSPIPRKSSTGKKLCDVVRNLQERKQAESPLTYVDTEAPSFLQDLKALDSRNSEKPKQVSEEEIVVPPFELAPAPSISSHLADAKDRASLVTLKQSTHSCTSGQRAPGDAVPDKITECSIHKKDLTLASSLEKELTVPLLLPSPVVNPLTTTKPTPILETNSASINNSNIAVTTFIPFPSINADPMLSMPIPSVNIAINTRPLTPLRPQTNIHVAPGHLPSNLLPPRITHLGHGVTIAPAPLAVNPASTLAEALKIPKVDQVPPKPSSKQVLIAPKPSWTHSPVSGNSGQGIGVSVKNAPKPIQIAPKFPTNTSQAASVAHLHSSTPILSASQVGHVIQGMPHAVQAMQSLPQGLQTVQGIPPGVQPLQAITQNFTTIAGMTSAVQAVITQTMAINQSQLVTPSSPKIITQPVFVTSSMPNMVATPFDMTMQNHLHSNVGAVARVVTQNVVGKVAPKPQASLVSSGTQSLVTLPPGSIETNVIPSLVPFHQTLQHGHPAQFVAVNMMPVAPSPIPLPGARAITSQMGPIICPQTMACMASSNAVAAGSVPSVSTPLNLIPPGSIVTCPIPDVNASICNANLLQPLQPISANNEGTQSIKDLNIPVQPVNSSLPTVTSESTTTASSSEEKETRSLVIDSTKVNHIVIDTSTQSETEHKVEAKETLGPDKPCEALESFQSIVDASKSSSEDKENNVRINIGDDDLNSTSTASQEQNFPGSCSNLLSTLKKNKRLQIELCSLERSSAFHSFPTVVSPPIVSQTVSKLYPVTTVVTESLSKSLSGSPINVTASDLAEATKTFSQTVANLPLNAITSHMILSNFVYTTTSVVIPKMPDQSITSPKAVTKVSQSSPPYVLSTSTSNDAPAQPLTNAALLPPIHSKENSFEPQNSINICSNTNSENTGMVQETVTLNNDPVVSGIAKTTPNHSKPVPSLVTTPIKHRGNISNLDANSIILSPKTFYNNVPNKSAIDDPVLKVPKPPTFEVKTSCNPVSSSLQMMLTTTSTSNSQVIIEPSRDSNMPRSEKQNMPIKSKFQSKDKKSIKSVNNSNVSGKQILKGRDFEKKREPILKKTLFKTKNFDEKKPSEAFSPLNESSVYAFEPDKDTLLEVTSPFSQRIKNIHPSPIISPVKPLTSFNLKNSTVLGKESLKDVKTLNKTKRTILANKNDFKVFSAKPSKDGISSTVMTSSPLSPNHQSMSKSVRKLAIGDHLKLPSLPNNNPIVNKVACFASSKAKKIIAPTLPSTTHPATPQLSSEVHVSRSSHQALTVKPLPLKRSSRDDPIWQSPPTKELPMKDPGKDITPVSSNPQENVKKTDKDSRVVFREMLVPTKEDNPSGNKHLFKERGIRIANSEEKQIKAKDKVRYVGKEMKLREIEVIPVDDALKSPEREIKQIRKDLKVMEGTSNLLAPYKETKLMEIEPKSLERLQKSFDKDSMHVERDAPPVDAGPRLRNFRCHSRDVRSVGRDVTAISRDPLLLEKDARHLKRDNTSVEKANRSILRETKLIKEVCTVERQSSIVGPEARSVEREASLVKTISKPVEREASPVKRGARAMEREARPMEREARPLEREARPVERETRPVERESRSVERESRPVERESQPVKGESKLVKRESKLLKRVPHPVNRDSQPVNRVSRPVNRESQPVERESQPVKKESSPVQRESRHEQRESGLVQIECGPVQIESTPVQIESTPVQIDSTPVQRESTPVQRESAPVQRESTPVQRESTPVQRESTPVQRESTPVQRESTPVQSESSPVQSESNPVQIESNSVERDSRTMERESRPMEKESRPLERESTPLERDSRPLERESRPLERESKPLERDSRPLERESRPLERESRPMEREFRCMEREFKRMERESRPMENESRSMERESRPMERESIPMERESRPMERETRPMENESIPMDNEPMESESRPMESESRPMGSESRPMGSESRPMGSESRPMGSESRPMGSESRPMGSESRPMGSESRPMGSESRPMGSESRPMGSESQPMGSESRPMGSESRPMGSESRPMGSESRPMGSESRPMGSESRPMGSESRPMGSESRPMGSESRPMGSESRPMGSESTPMGSESTPMGSESTPMGSESTPMGSESTPMGSESTPMGSESTPMGSESTPMGSESTPMGSESTPMGSESTPMGSESRPMGSESRLMESESRLMESESRLMESESRLMESESRLMESESRPMESESRPMESESRPMESESRPMESESRPMESESRPMESESRPMESESRPMESESRPMESESRPMESESRPMESESRPMESESRPMESESRPMESESRPMESESRSMERGSRSMERGSRSMERGSRPMERESRPMERESRPMERESRLMERESRPMERESRSMERESRPMERESRPMERESRPMERESRPMERESRPMERESRPMERESRPMERESRPMERESRPMERESRPMERESRPMERESRPMERESRPMERESRPMECESRPTERETRPLEKQPKLVERQHRLLERQHRLLERQHRLIEGQPIPMKSDDNPVESKNWPLERESRPVEREARLVERGSRLVERVCRSVERKVKSLEKDPILTQEDGIAVETYNIPIERETCLPKGSNHIEIERISIDKEAKSISKDAVSLRKEHTSAQEHLLVLDQESNSVRNISKVNLKDLESESNDSEELEIEAVNIKVPAIKASSSTSIAIQCDLDDSQDELRGNESGTQTEGPSKFPLPPSASPFYYLPLAMATLGEKLPAQLVQQMLAKTQGLVGAAEAGLILQQAAQLAQQYHRTTEEEGPPSLPPSPAVKPISPKSGSIALQKALRANLASIAQAEISVAQSSGISLSPSSPPPPSPKELHIPSLVTSPKGLLKVAASLSDSFTVSSSPKSKEKVLEKASKSTPALFLSLEKESVELPEPQNSPLLMSAESTPVKTPPSKTAPSFQPQLKSKPSKMLEVTVKRRSGRSSTLAATKATESDLHEVEEQRRNRKAKRVAAALAKEEGWSSSSEAPMSPVMSPDILRGWPPPRLTSPTPSQSSDGTTASSSTLSQWSRVSAPHSRRQSPASGIESIRRGAGRFSVNTSSNIFSADPVIDPGPLHISEQPRLARAPSFFPSEEEFTDPLDYIEKIRPEAEQFGLCRIVPPSTFRPECRVNDDMRFTAYKQYIHRMMRRWGPNDHALRAIKKCLAKQNIELASNPVIGGLELDLVQLYKVVEKHGGLMKVIEKELWTKVADVLRIPKSAQDRVAKLDRIYCKYLLPYAMLSKGEREQLLAEVEAAHKRFQSDEGSKKSAASNESSDDDDDEPLECIVKGKSTALSGFYRIARNVAGQWQPDPLGLEFDERYWDTVKEGESYICVHTASIDTSEHSYGFPSQKNSPNAKHPWNLKNLCQNPNSVLRSMGNVIGVTAPTLHVGMMFSSVCWYRDPHSLPWIEYLHTGACKIWYGVSASNEENFRSALSRLVPDFIKDSPLWLPSDTAMVPPEDLTAEGVKVCRVVQEPGQFVVVFPGAFTSSVCSGYLISESAFFARPLYFDRAVPSFKMLFECCEPSMFSLDRLALSVASDTRATLDALIRARQVVATVVEREKCDRHSLVQLGLTANERLSTPDAYRKRRNRYVEDDEENCCEICRQHLYVSLVTNLPEETVYCLQHAISFLTKSSSHLSSCKLMYTYSLPELTSLLKQMDDRIHTKANKKISTTSIKRGKFCEQDSLSSTSGSNF